MIACGNLPPVPYLYLYLYAFFFVFFWTKRRRVFNVSGMSKTTKMAMKKIRRQITRFEGLCQSHCGHAELVQKAVDARFALEHSIECTIENLAKELGLE